MPTKRNWVVIPENTQSSNKNDRGQYWDAPKTDDYAYNSKAWVRIPNEPDKNYYNHEDIETNTRTLMDNGIDVPEPDVAKSEKKKWWEQITDPISSLQYGLARGIKNLVDDDKNTKFFKGVGEGLAAGIDPKSKRLDNRTSFIDVFKTALGSNSAAKRAVGAIPTGVINNAWESLPIDDLIYLIQHPDEKIPLVGKNQAYDPVNVKDIINATKNNKEAVDLLKSRATAAGIAGDMFLDPLNAINGVLKAPGAIAKGSDALQVADKVNDVSKASDALKAIGKVDDAQNIDYLIRKTQKLLGGMPDYRGITVDAFGKSKTLVSPETLAKIGDKTGLANIGKGIKMAENTQLGQDFTKLFRFGRNGEWINAARKNPDDALKYIAQTQGVKDLLSKKLFRNADVLKQTEDFEKMNVNPEEMQDVRRSLEGIMDEKEITHTVTENVVNPAYQQAVNKSKSKISYQIRELAKQKAYLEKKIASFPQNELGDTIDAITEQATAKAQLVQLQQELTMLNNVKSTVDLSYARQLKNAGIDFKTITNDRTLPFAVDPSEISTRNIDEVTELITAEAQASGKALAPEQAREFAIRLKQAADNYIDSATSTYPDLQYLYTKEVAVDDLTNGLAKTSREDLLKQLKEETNKMATGQEYDPKVAANIQKQLRELDAKSVVEPTAQAESTLGIDPMLENYINKEVKPKQAPVVEPKATAQKLTYAEREAAVDKWLAEQRKNAPVKSDVPQPTKNVDTTALDESLKVLAKKADYDDITEDYFKNSTWQQKAALRDKFNQIIKDNAKPLSDKQKNWLRMNLNKAGISTTKADIEKIGHYKFQQIADMVNNNTLGKMTDELRNWKDPSYTEQVRSTFSDLLEYERVKFRDSLNPKDKKYKKAPSLRANKDKFMKTEVNGKEIDKLETLANRAKLFEAKRTTKADIKRLEDLIADYKSKGKATTGFERQLANMKEKSLDKSLTATDIIERYDKGIYVSAEEVNEAKKALNDFLNEVDPKRNTPLHKLANGTTNGQNSPTARIMQFVNKKGQRVGIDELASPKTAESVLKASDELPDTLKNANKQINIVKADNGLAGVNTKNSTTIFDNAATNVKDTVAHESTHAADRAMSKGDALVNPERTKLVNTMTKEINGNPEFADLTHVNEGSKNVSNAESVARLAERLLGDDLTLAANIRTKLPKTAQAFYDFIAKTPIDNIVDEISATLPKRIKAKDELVERITKTKETVDTFEQIFKDVKQQNTIDNVIHKIDSRIKEYEKNMLDIDFLKNKNPDLFKDVPEFNTIEKDITEKVVKPLALGEKAQSIHDTIKQAFKDWASEEEIDELDNYVTHLLNWDLKNNKKTAKLYEDVFNPFDKYGMHRTIDGTIDKINAAMAEKYGDKLKGKPFFETLITRIYMERGLYHNKFMFDKEYSDQTLKLFGKRIDSAFYDTLPDAKTKAKYWDEVNKLANNPDYVIVKAQEKYTPIEVKTLSNDEISEGYVRRTAKRETARLVETDNPIVEQLRNMQINNPYIEINPKNISKEKVFTKDATPIYVMPRDAYNAYINSVKNQFNKHNNALVSMFDKIMSTWKSGAIMSPGFHQTNAIGNVFNSSLEIGGKILDPELNAVAAALQGDKIKGSFMGKSFDEWRQILKEQGMKDVTFFSDNMTEFRRGEIDNLIREKQSAVKHGKDILNKLANPMSDKFIPRAVNQKIGSAIEGQARIVNFLAQVQSGKSYDEAADLVNKVLFDYQDLTPFEHNVMKRLVPFYTWIRKNAPLQISEFLDKPTKYSHTANTMRNIQVPETANEKRYKPDYLNDAIHVGKNTYKNLRLPFQDLTKMTDASEMFSSVNPLIKMAIELGANKNYFTGQPIDEGYGVKATGLLKKIGYDTPKGKMIDPKLKYVLQSVMPGTNRINDLLQGLSKDATSAEKAKVQRTWNPAHLQEFKVDIKQQKTNAMYDYINKLQEAVKKARKEGRLK